MEEDPAQNPPPVAKVRSYKRLVPLQPLTIPTLPPLASTSSPTSVAPSPITPVSSTSAQTPLRAKRRSKWEKVDDILSTYGFHNLGDFLATLFYHHARGEEDPRTPRHAAAVTAFLQGASTFKMANLIELIYDHPQSRPRKKFPDQVSAAFSPRKSLDTMRFARPCLSAWAARTVGDEVYRRIGRLAKKSDDPESRTHVRAATNGRTPDANVATWDHMEFTIQRLADQYREADEFVWYLTECFCAPRVKGKVVVRKRRPHPVIQVGAISSFIISRNSYASGDLALPLGIWHFACKSHVDVKRVYCRFGSIVSDSTARKALNSMSAASLETLQASVRDATARGESEWGKILDNVQQYSTVYEHGLGRENQLKVGTACTAFRFQDCKPGAFDANDHIARSIKQERQSMTTENVFASIDWSHNSSVTELHLVRVLAEFTPHLNPLTKEISARFREAPIVKHRLRANRKTPVQPLATNTEREVETQGMARALVDFDGQMGVEPEKSDNLLSWARGDGASHTTMQRLKKYLAVTPDIYKSFNVISTPETWHTKATDLNACASNHYGPAASKDPSSLSRSSNAANMKRPTDLEKCDFYPTSRSMTLIWEARALDCWRHILGIDSDIHAHFEELAAHDAPPSVDDLLEQASILRERYASQSAYDQSLSKEEYDDASPRGKVPRGSPWTARCAREGEPTAQPEIDTDMPGTDGPKIHTEEAGFDGDRVFSNAILFLMEFGWWIELNYAIPEGDVGRVMEILKIFIFTFGGTSNQNYMGYMLDLYALLEFECSPELKEALLNNWLINLSGEIGKWLEGDLMQEHYIKWLEDMVSRRGGDFDDKFYRQTISPNVHNFLKIKENIESAFELKRRGKSHTSPHLRDETKILLRMYKEEELHLFRSGRSMGHAAINRFDRGYQRLEGGKMAEFLERSAVYANILHDMELTRKHPEGAQVTNADPESPPSSDRSSSPQTPHSDRSPSSTSIHSIHSSASRSSRSSASRSAADSVHAWDDVDDSDEHLTSGSDLAVTIDSETGRMSADWYEEEEFESVLERLCGAEELETSEEEDEPDSSEAGSDSE
ncbi:hypothetical protein B0H11DRAFT_1848485 [Mycena galericulata]|nr:hypothetical protein B0H11DRAFT_1891144 [Mycena galericulata]KAJ7439138.1 hypothetical protein B0H11DRAFT_1884100 [Mycena galericulata]KAJ7475492.1 hypothetical protein B0H11DRAFT_1865558 [Mycena galericulata]KAJ7508226.1 hypothetical protein B0H11DRAFT_1848485 [Mycena galericulata]